MTKDLAMISWIWHQKTRLQKKNKTGQQQSEKRGAPGWLSPGKHAAPDPGVVSSNPTLGGRDYLKTKKEIKTKQRM